VTVKKLLYKDGSVLYSCRDITKYKKFEEMLHLVRTAVDEAAEAIIITDLEGNLIYSNESFRKFFGDKADLVFNAYNIFPLNLNSEYKYSEQRAFKGWKAETELETIGGGKMSALVNSSIISDTNDIPAYTLFIISDISEQKKAREDARIKHEQLVQADKMKTLGTLVSGVGHEINNPNSFIMLNAPALKEMFEEALPVLREWCALKGSDKVGRFKLELIEKRAPLLIKGVLEGSVRIKNIVQSLKDFARQAPSGLSDGVSVSEVVKSSVALVGNRIKNSTRKFVVEMGDNIPAVRGNFQRLEQVVINLIINAAEALPDKDKGITVKTSFDKDRGFAVIEVADEGRGIPDDIIDQITHPFFTTKRDTGGTGLGLSISNGIVTEHGGFLRFKSKVGNGTSAFVELPVSKS
jgi:PAS domain S-box-containing protein